MLASGRDDRAVSPRGEAKSISVEDTFDSDLTDPAVIASVIERDARAVAGRLTRAGLFARTVTVKVRLADFTTLSRSRTLSGATDNPERIAATAQALITGVRIGQGFRLIGVGVGGFAQAAQEELFVPTTSRHPWPRSWRNARWPPRCGGAPRAGHPGPRWSMTSTAAAGCGDRAWEW